MDEILYELREHAAGLNAGRWDYIFSIIKKFRARPEMALPDRAQVTMTVPFMRAYTELLVRTCHRRGAHAIGGMAAFIPSRRDPEANERALAKVREDKQRESGDGFDGTWVAHPDLVAGGPRDLRRRPWRPPEPEGPAARGGARVTAGAAASTFAVPGGGGHRGRRPRRTSPSASPTSRHGWPGTARPRSTTSWRTRPPPRSAARSCGSGGPHAVQLDDGAPMTADRYARSATRSLHALRAALPDHRWDEAAELLDDLVLSDDFADFLTLEAYRRLEP